MALCELHPMESLSHMPKDLTFYTKYMNLSCECFTIKTHGIIVLSVHDTQSHIMIFNYELTT